MDTTVNQRIKELIDYLQLSDREFAKQVEIPQTTISSYFKRGSEPSMSAIVRILKTFDFVDIEWLVLGKGSMIKEEVIENTDTNNIMMKTIIELSGKCAILEEKNRVLESNHIDYNLAADATLKYSKQQIQ